MFIPKEKTIIEVKSTYTFTKDKEKNLRKFDAVIKSGYNTIVYVFEHKRKLMDILYANEESDHILCSSTGWCINN